jgi:hypothetical protein
MEEGKGGDWRPGLKWRTAATPVVGVIWLVGVLIWWAFYSEDYSIAQKLAVVILSILVMAGIAGTLWLPWSMRFAPEKDRRVWRTRGFVPRVAGSVAIIILAMLLTVYWLFFPGEDYDLCQSLVVIIVIFLVTMGIMAPVWVRWGTRHAERELEGVAREVEETAAEEIDRALDEVEAEIEEARAEVKMTLEDAERDVDEALGDMERE